MALALVKNATGTSLTATTTATFSTAPTSGNLIVMTMSTDAYNGTPDAGWTQSTGMEQQTYHGGYIWWQISNGANSFPYTIGAATRSTWVLAEFSGNHATPYDISNGAFQQLSGVSLLTPTITPTSGNRLLVTALTANDGQSVSAVTQSWTNSFTNINVIGAGTGTVNNCCGMAYQIVAANGSTGYSSTGSFAGVTNTAARCALIISFKEAGAVAGGRAKVWNGVAWVQKPAKVWSGSAWVTKPVKIWNGTAWI